VPRDLADVLHYFIPELEDESGHEAEPRSVAAPEPRRQLAPDIAPIDESEGVLEVAQLPLLGVPIGDRDVVRAALTWNLAVEIARLGERAIILAPTSQAATPLWPEAGVGPLGTELHFCAARDLDELTAVATDLARKCVAADPKAAGAVFVRVPPEWLEADSATEDRAPLAIQWWLLMSSAHHGDLAEAHHLASSIQRHQPEAHVGVTIQGVSAIAEAERAFEHLSRRCASELELDLVSYGLLVDDLHVYRAIAAQRPIGLAHPQAPATRALMDVARLLAEDARSGSVA
jgi:hypothetical protein